MEEAYTELYQQFLHLRSLCLRQAALLHQLTTALQKQQGPGASVPNAEMSDMMSIPVQCTSEIPVHLQEEPQPLTTTQNPEAQCGHDRLSRNVGTFSDLLAEDMSKLCVGMPRQRREDVKVDTSRCHGASYNESKNSDQNHPGGDRTMYTMPVTDSPSLDDDFLNQCGGALMSDVALQSHVCEFCQAVFPGDTTTRGEFLRHLYTHVT